MFCPSLAAITNSAFFNTSSVAKRSPRFARRDSPAVRSLLEHLQDLRLSDRERFVQPHKIFANI